MSYSPIIINIILKYQSGNEAPYKNLVLIHDIFDKLRECEHMGVLSLEVSFSLNSKIYLGNFHVVHTGW